VWPTQAARPHFRLTAKHATLKRLAGGACRSLQQLAAGYTIEVGQLAIRACARIKTCHQLDQLPMRAIRKRDRQRLLIERLDISAHKAAQQPAQGRMLRLFLGQVF
jgi:hypothetical protein